MAWWAGSAARPESRGFRRGLLFNWDATFGGGITPVHTTRRGGITPSLHDPTLFVITHDKKPRTEVRGHRV
jgi:hypothetical protein